MNLEQKTFLKVIKARRRREAWLRNKRNLLRASSNPKPKRAVVGEDVRSFWRIIKDLINHYVSKIKSR